MIKITTNDIKGKELLTLPFITACNNHHYMYFKGVGDHSIKCLVIETGEMESADYVSIQDAIDSFGSDETIVDAELIIKRR